MIKINLIEDILRPGEKVKERELTVEEQSTVISSISSPEQVIFFQQGDEDKYNKYLEDVTTAQESYISMLQTIIFSLG
jgi:hypothetical protein